jgi:hypothetical protein
MESKDVTLETVEKAEVRAGTPAALTEEEQRLQRKLKWKLDLIILPLLSTVYFFAQMVRAEQSRHSELVLTSYRVDPILVMLKSWAWTRN